MIEGLPTVTYVLQLGNNTVVLITKQNLHSNQFYIGQIGDFGIIG